ncbi:sarcosine oxidase subunit gamma [Tabrizicola sp.]|uniref:sarcosine oxidase subunit gamma n=1 Tax=Tabrizicola sp. TaxID=2005166 RepID=UPI00286A2770|nr:sarcosine oxidase subunit gamma [Tabrizicola sp.]
MGEAWQQMTALGHVAANVIDIGAYRIAERFDVSLASVATRRGRDGDVAQAAKAAGVPLPKPSEAFGGQPFSGFWLAPEMWMIEAPFDSHEDIAAHLKTVFGAAASITEQTDAWVRFDVSGGNLVTLFERLSNLDLSVLPNGHASRTVIEHLGCYLIKRSADLVTLYGPRSSAQSLLHALEVTAKSVI